MLRLAPENCFYIGEYIMENTKIKTSEKEVVGVDLHADQFTAALLTGDAAAEAERQWTHHAVDNSQWEQWLKHSVPRNAVLVMEAGSNSFEFASAAEKAGYKAVVLESERIGQLSKSYCKTDKVDAVKLARIYLSGLAPEVWQPDALTRQRRELCSAYNRAVTDATRSTNRLKNYLTAHGIRLSKKKLNSENTRAWISSAYNWSPLQQEVLEGMFSDFDHAHHRRAELHKTINREALNCPEARTLMSLCGIRARTAFEMVAVIGDIRRFSNAKKLVAYIGLNPTVNESGKTVKGGRVRKRGCKPLRAKLIQAAKSFMNAKNNGDNPVKKWGLKMKMSKGANKAVAAVARKLVVAAWYLLNGAMPKNLTTEEQIRRKLKKLTEEMTAKGVKAMGYRNASELIEEHLQCFSLLTT